MLRWMCSKTRWRGLDMTILERESWGSTYSQMVENRVMWFGHVERRPIDFVVRRVDQMEDGQITRGRGRPRKTIT